MEEIGQNYGFLLYRTAISNTQKEVLRVSGLHDRAIILVDMVGMYCPGYCTRRDENLLNLPGMTLKGGVNREFYA